MWLPAVDRRSVGALAGPYGLHRHGQRGSRCRGAARGKGEWWADAHEIHSSEVEGPYVNGDQFVVRFKMDLTQKASGERIKMDEVGLYTVKNGKIAEERFFYGE